MYAVLRNKLVVPVAEFLDWVKETKYNRNVSKTIVGDVEISTVFLGIDHNYFGDEPLWFETMIFGGKFDEYQERYTTWDQAEEGHKKAVALVRKGE